MSEPRAWIIEPTGQTPTLAWMCRECWAGGGNLNEAAPHSVSTKHAVQFERIEDAPTTEEVRPTETRHDRSTGIPVARGADAEHASAPSTEPDLSEFDRLLMAVIEAVWWEALWDEEERTPHTDRVRALDQTRAALRLWVAELSTDYNRLADERLQPLRDAFARGKGEPSALVELIREARGLADSLESDYAPFSADLIRCLADALEATEKDHRFWREVSQGLGVECAKYREALQAAEKRIRALYEHDIPDALADAEQRAHYESDVAAQAIQAMKAAEHRLALATADTERLDWMQLYIVDYTEEAGDDMNEAIAELTGDLAIDLEVALIESRGDLRTAIDAARSSSLTDTPEGA